jgi:hypothetical protein
MLWLECEAYQENVQSIPEGDYTDQETNIFKKFFRKESNFSLLEEIPENLRHLILAALYAMGLETSRNNNYNTNIVFGNFATRKGFGSQLLVDAKNWVEEDMTNGSFRKFVISDTSARMIGYLRFSPPFVKMSLMDVLRCDRKCMYFVVFLCQIKRFVIQYYIYIYILYMHVYFIYTSKISSISTSSSYNIYIYI